jgi:ACS family hexuronate transporter-like MFS transporter
VLLSNRDVDVPALDERIRTMSPGADAVGDTAAAIIWRRRWIIGFALALITAINYLDRQTLPVVISEIQRDIPVSNADFARLQALFLFAYAVMYAGGGRLVDLFGSRVGYAVVAGFWSLACMGHALAQSISGLGTARFLLGLGEGGGFPASAKVVAEWFPARERSLAVGMFNTGSALGAVIAPPLIAAIVFASGWRMVFVVTGAIGLVWAAVWFFTYAPPAAAPAAASRANQPARISWLSLFQLPSVWTLLVAKFLTDGAWFFFIFWLPKYLADARGFNMAAIGAYAWIPYAFAGFGSLAGGWFSAQLIRRGVSLGASRKISLGVAAALMPLSLLVVQSPVGLAILLVSLAFLAHQFWSVIMQTLPTDLFPPHAVGSVAGLIGSAGSFGAMLFNLLVGALLDTFGTYTYPFLLAGIMHPISFVIIVLTLKRIGSDAPATRTRLEALDDRRAAPGEDEL